MMSISFDFSSSLSIYCHYVYIWMCVYVWVRAPECNAHGSQKRTSDSLELELQVFMSHHAGAGKRTLVLCKSSWCSKALSHSPDPFLSSCSAHTTLRRDGAQ